MYQQSSSPRPRRRGRTLHAGVLCLTLIAGALPSSAQTQVPASPPTQVPATPPAATTGSPPAVAVPVPDAARPAAPDAIQPPQAQPAPDLSSLLPRDLSPWGMFTNADNLVKAVMIGLAFASVVTWTIALAKWLELGAFKLQLRKLHRAIAGARSLAEAQARVGQGRSSAAGLVRAAVLELEKSPDRSDREGIRERLAATIERIEATVGRQLGRGTGILGTIGATAPFVGLFGTVWGIMNSFIGISKAHTTNLAVVAPGIAEALLATALGLAAAIPAVVIYNYLARSIAGCKALFANTSTEVLNLTSREIAQPAERRRAPVAPARFPAE
jgi:biopolymer transport protein ExbB